ncbi:branched-chain amino acid transport system substrate-binding protein [Allocatelliglobosispora scoriae]|uniref:Branched-chain amino acid transport system substrate-binding protein n=1 Tax=Allocatelliglobosispora scoriae TaxID=643052 RepID=A0A841BQM5_9ACTN|nr:ABC transporter substrate-binding protein [Allocatelliglobosispora scoriae]MBB5869636.1 branched-chain amino acid transport system substrate-binding protein [Allocatelliglobosispora scoriae]
MSGALSRRAILIAGLGLLSPLPRAARAIAMPLPPLRIGVIADLTGPLAAVGKRQLMGIQYRADAINALGGHGAAHQLELLVRDTASTDAAIPPAASGLLEEGVHALIGPSAPWLGRAITEAGQTSCTPTLLPTSGPAPTQPYAFQSAPSAEQVTKAMMRAAKAATGVTKVGVLATAPLAGPDQQTALTEAASAAGLSVAGVEQFPADATDLAAAVTALLAKTPEALVISAVPPQVAYAVRDARAGGFTGPIIVPPDAVHPDFFPVAGDGAEGVTAPAPWLAAPAAAPDTVPNLATLRRFTEGFAAEHGPADAAAGYAADAISLLYLAYLGHRDRKMARMQLEEMCCVGVTGVYNMMADDHAGLDDGALSPLVAKSGAWTTL